MAKNNKKIIRYKKPKNINIGILVFAVIFLYLIIVIAQYMTKNRIKMYEVQDGDIANDSIYTGLILRNEAVASSEYAGTVNYYVREKQKAAVGNLIYTIDENGSMAEYLNQSVGEASRLSDSNLKELKEKLSDFSKNYSNQKFTEVYDLNSSVNSLLMEYINIQALQSANLSDNNISFQKCYAQSNGLIIYSADGLESLQPEQITAESFQREAHQKTVFTGGEMINSGSPVYKTITDDKWYIMIQIPEEEKEVYTDVSRVRLRFTDRDLETAADFSMITGADGKLYGKLTLNKFMVQFATDRYVNIEVKNQTDNGLKIPVSSLTQKEAYVIPADYVDLGGDSQAEGVYRKVYGNDGSVSVEFTELSVIAETEENFYVSTDLFENGDILVRPQSTEEYQIGPKETLDGVYNINRGYAVFKYVDIITRNSEYCVVKKNVYYSLRLYDHIVLNAPSVKEGEVLR